MAVFKKQWTGVEQQAPNPLIKIYTQGVSGEADITYSPDSKAGPWSKLLEYSFSESVDDLEGSFSFSVENAVDEEGKSIFDLIPIRSVVKIYEGDMKKAAFVGIIRRRHLGMTMTGQGAKRSITFTGKSIISCITEYTISLDIKIHNVADPESKRKDLTDKLAQDGMTIQKFMTISWEHFKEVSEQFGISTTGLASVISNFVGGPGKFIEVSGDAEFRYNIACIFYNAANNVIADVWRNILPAPVYEMFSRCNKNGEPRIVVRQVPFDMDDWKTLDIYEISPISLISYDLDQSDEEVFTAFVSYIIGSTREREFYMAVHQMKNKDDIVAHDEEKQKIYGFKPLQINFIGYDRQGNLENKKNPDLKDGLKELNKRAKDWYSRLDEMYSGSITLITDFNQPDTNPRAGCRAKFLGGEFYIEKTDHNWKFGGTPTIKLSVSRGMMYGQNGAMGQAIKDVAKFYRELEEAG